MCNRKGAQTRQWGDPDEFSASFHLSQSGKQAEVALPDFSHPASCGQCSHSISPCQRAFSDPILSCKHFLVCISSMHLSNYTWFTWWFVHLLAACHPPASKLPEGRDKPGWLRILSPAQSMAIWQGSLHLQSGLSTLRDHELEVQRVFLVVVQTTWFWVNSFKRII